MKGYSFISIESFSNILMKLTPRLDVILCNAATGAGARQQRVTRHYITGVTWL